MNPLDPAQLVRNIQALWAARQASQEAAHAVPKPRPGPKYVRLMDTDPVRVKSVLVSQKAIDARLRQDPMLRFAAANPRNVRRRRGRILWRIRRSVP